jgi:hypothetical protein
MLMSWQQSHFVTKTLTCDLALTGFKDSGGGSFIEKWAYAGVTLPAYAHFSNTFSLIAAGETRNKVICG